MPKVFNNVTKEEKFQINNLSFLLKKLEKEGQSKPKASREKGNNENTSRNQWKGGIWVASG